MPNYVKPAEVVKAMVIAGQAKAKLGVMDTALRSVYSGLLLGAATTLAYTGTTQTGAGIVGALIFPCGFVLIVLFGLELVTGNFCLVPIGVFARQATLLQLLRNWAIVWAFNFLGSLLYMAFWYGAICQFGDQASGPVVDAIVAAGKAKTTKYAPAGGVGWASCFFKAILCNWLVSLGTVCGMTTTSTTGKVIACWLPILMFFAQGFEHIVVNMFVIPCSMWLGSGVSWGNWWLYNMLPVTLGNIFGAVVLVTIPMWATWGHEYRKDVKEALELQKELESTEYSMSAPYAADPDCGLVAPTSSASGREAPSPTFHI